MNEYCEGCGLVYNNGHWVGPVNPVNLVSGLYHTECVDKLVNDLRGITGLEKQVLKEELLKVVRKNVADLKKSEGNYS